MPKQKTKIDFEKLKKFKAKNVKQLHQIRADELANFIPKAKEALDKVQGSFILVALQYDKKGVPKGSQQLTAVLGPDVEYIHVINALENAKHHVLMSAVKNVTGIGDE